MQPNAELAQAAGLDVDRGVLCDERLRTSDEWIWACGDVARAWHPLYERHLRVEHWANALNQSQACARSVLDRGDPYDRVPYFYSHQYDVAMEFLGDAEGHDEIVVRGDLDAFECTVFYLREGRVLAAMPVGSSDPLDGLRALIASRATPDVKALVDPGVDLATLV
jgi:3-phenylpropionate/trans-cinnamate dioxygenase ferredoxin reductase subunit